MFSELNNSSRGNFKALTPIFMVRAYIDVFAENAEN